MLFLDEGSDGPDVNSAFDYGPAGVKLSRVSFGGIDVSGIDSSGRATLRNASGGSDGAVRSAINSVLGSAAARAWDDGPNQDSIHGSFVSGYVAVRTRIRAMLADLPT